METLFKGNGLASYMKGLVASAVAAVYLGIIPFASAEQITVKVYNISGPYSFDGNRMRITMNNDNGYMAMMECRGQDSSRASGMIKLGSIVVLDDRKMDGPFIGCLDAIFIDGKFVEK